MAEIIIFSDVAAFFGFSRYAGAYRVATELRQYGYNVRVIDYLASMTPEEACELLEVHCGKETLWVGIASSLLAEQNPLDERLAIYVRGKAASRVVINSSLTEPKQLDVFRAMKVKIEELNPDTKFVLGGHFAAFEYDHLPFDVLVQSSADTSAVALSNHLKFGHPLKYDKVNSDVIRINADMYPVHDFPHSRIVWTEDDYIFPGEGLPMEIARGCIFRCAFCAYPLLGKKPGDFTRTPETIRDELIRNYEMFGTTNYILTDDTINDSVEKLETLHGIFTSLPFKMRYDCYARADLIHKFPDMKDLLLESGAQNVFFGVETFHREAGKAIGKGLDPNKIKDVLYSCKEAWGDEVVIATGFIVGLPQEPVESLRQTFNWLLEPDCPVDSPSVVPLYIKSKNDSIAANNDFTFSKMANDPNKYGYDEVADGYWKNKHMDKPMALELVQEFYLAKSSSQYPSHRFGVWMTTLLNIGLSRQDILDVTYGKTPFIEGVIKGHRNQKAMRASYMDAIRTGMFRYSASTD